MTAFPSILGFMPLLIASGAGAASRQAVGNAVVGGMIAATLFSLLFVPSFFVVFRWLGELGSKDGSPQPTSTDEKTTPADKPPTAEDEADTADPPTTGELGDSEKSDDQNH